MQPQLQSQLIHFSSILLKTTHACILFSNTVYGKSFKGRELLQFYARAACWKSCIVLGPVICMV